MSRQQIVDRKAALTLRFVLPVVIVLSSQSLLGEGAIEHPFIEQKEIRPETCLMCHPGKKAGKFVHSAVGMGCENCHRVVSEKNKTTITLIATGGGLCATCHEPKKSPVLHGPYKNGQCLMCHDPHSSDFRAEARAEGNSLCLACHAPKQVRSDAVVLFGSQEIPGAYLDTVPKIELDPALRFGHPLAAHPVAGVADPLRGGEMMSCLSCHDPHGTAQPKLIIQAKGGGDICDACHRARAAQKNAGIKSQP